MPLAASTHWRNFGRDGLLNDLVCHRVVDLPTPPMPAFIVRCVQCNAQIWVTLNSPSDVKRICTRCAKDV